MSQNDEWYQPKEPPADVRFCEYCNDEASQRHHVFDGVNWFWVCLDCAYDINPEFEEA